MSEDKTKEMQRAYQALQKLRQRPDLYGSAGTLFELQELLRAEGNEVDAMTLRAALRQDWKLRFLTQQHLCRQRQTNERD